MVELREVTEVLDAARAADAVATLQRASVARGGDDLAPEAVESEIAAVRGKRRR